jgi:hypothetical protein
MATTTEYPEHDKLAGVSETSQSLGELIELLSARGYQIGHWEGRESSQRTLCRACEQRVGAPIYSREEERFVPVHAGITQILAELFDVDLAKLDEEKDAMLKALRAASERRP